MKEVIKRANELREQVNELDAKKLKAIILEELDLKIYQLEQTEKLYLHKQECIRDAIDDRQIKDIIYYDKEMERVKKEFGEHLRTINDLDFAIYHHNDN